MFNRKRIEELEKKVGALEMQAELFSAFTNKFVMFMEAQQELNANILKAQSTMMETDKELINRVAAMSTFTSVPLTNSKH